MMDLQKYIDHHNQAVLRLEITIDDSLWCNPSGSVLQHCIDRSRHHFAGSKYELVVDDTLWIHGIETAFMDSIKQYYFDSSNFFEDANEETEVKNVRRGHADPCKFRNIINNQNIREKWCINDLLPEIIDICIENNQDICVKGALGVCHDQCSNCAQIRTLSGQLNHFWNSSELIYHRLTI